MARYTYQKNFLFKIIATILERKNKQSIKIPKCWINNII